MSWDKKQISILTTVSVTSFLGTFLISSVNIALPQIEEVFDMDAVSLSWIITAFLLASAIFLLPVGRLADLTGLRRVYRTGVTIFTIFTILSAFSLSGWMLILFRFLKGIGASMVMSTGPAILVSSFPPTQRGRVLGISVSAVYIGLALGPFAGGLITQQLGWRWIFIISALLGLAALTLNVLYLREDKPFIYKSVIDIKSSLIYALALGSLVAGSSFITSLFGQLAVVAGLVFVVLFIYNEKLSGKPVIDINLFVKNRLFAYSNIAALINYSATFAIVFLLSLYLQKIKGLTAQEAGTVLLAQPLMMAILSPLTGRLSDRVDPKIPATIGMLLCAIGLIFFSFLNSGTSILFVVINLLLVGSGFGLFSSPNMNTIMSSVEKRQYGTATGIAATMRILGQIISMTLVTLFFSLYIGQERIAVVDDELFLTGMKVSFIVFAAICFCGVWFSYARNSN
ncbi:MFS transporter [Marinilabiliaceae bacterium ANBcel2]|nr:MFS transporter [Marinilabiliaceae bacterium ANBcel2]